MDRILATPEEVILNAIPQASASNIKISEASILVAQQKFIKPVLNNLYLPLCEGRFPELTEKYIKPALSYFACSVNIYSMTVIPGINGIVAVSNDYMAPASAESINRMYKNLRSHAYSLLRSAIEHIESHPQNYPEYDPELNILNELRITSGIII